MPKYTPFSIKLEIWGFKGYGFSLARIQEIYKKMEKQGKKIPHKNTVQKYSHEYDLFEQSKKDAFEALFKEWTPLNMPDGVPYSTIPIILYLKQIFSLLPDLHLPLFTKGIAKWSYMILCAFGIQENEYSDMIGKIKGISIINIHRETSLFKRISGFNAPFSNQEYSGRVEINYSDILKWSEQCLVWEVEQEIEGIDNSQNFNKLFDMMFSLRTDPRTSKGNWSFQAPRKYIDESVDSLIRRFNFGVVKELVQFDKRRKK